ncbi:nucleolar transcription factor 1-like isoform X3 [Gymnodraco acuticeps]|uniref:Nucleolar transcription factor 1-like isoform X3 n=1 Tax=Gymnodraco acuticeps TaxID=8218 RepID=A0A6P8UZ24_GYMAC|nr:nucleolar transcription factor 1-like isoform X3 [Gymnodraco acuticeps]
MSGTTTVPEESDTEWTQEDTQELLAAMKTIAARQKHIKGTYLKALKHVDWKEVAFDPFTPEACKNKWGDILQKLQKIRTLAEILVEAEDVISNPLMNTKIHPDHPKRPTPPNAIFCEENWVSYHNKYPDIGRPTLFRRLANKYQALPDEEKAQYEKKFNLATVEYKKKKEEFKKQYESRPNKKRKKLSDDSTDQMQEEEQTEDAICMPPKPPFNGYNIFCKEQPMTGLPNTAYTSVWAQRWSNLTDRERERYTFRCKQMKREYAVKLNEYLKTFDQEEQQKILKANGIKTPKIHPDHPKRPIPPNAIFCEENWVRYHNMHQDISQRKLFRRLDNKYQALPDEEKAQYEEKFNLATVEYKKKKEEFKKQRESRPNKKRKKLSDDSTDQMQEEEQTEDAICMPPKPPFNGYNIFCKEQPMTGLPNTAYTSVWAQRWSNLTDRERERYTFRCKQMKREYAVKLNEYLKTFDQEEQQKILKANGIKTPKRDVKTKKVPKKIPGEPKKPINANIIFCKKQMVLFKETFPNSRERFAKANQMWRKLSYEDKNCFIQEVNENMKGYSMQLQKWFKTLSRAQQESYRTSNPSDSEDEIFEDCNSEQEWKMFDFEEDEEEEEEDDENITFEMF